jgi:hypothetical protein
MAKYKLKFGKDSPPVDDAYLEHMSGVLSELGIPEAAVQRIVDHHQLYVGRAFASDKANQERAHVALKAELGSNYAATIAAGQRGVRALGLDEKTMRALDANMEMGQFVRLFAAIGRRFDSVAPQPQPNSGNNPTGANDPLSSPEQAKAEIDRLQRDPAFRDSLFNKGDAKHVENKQRWDQLHAAAWPAPERAAPESAAAHPTDDSKAAANAKINDLIGNAGFMASLQDKSHPEHRANRETFDQLHAEAGITR